MQYNLAEDAWEKHEVSCCLDPPVSFFVNPPSTQFVFVWNEKSLAFGRVNETGAVAKGIVIGTLSLLFGVVLNQHFI